MTQDEIENMTGEELAKELKRWAKDNPEANILALAHLYASMTDRWEVFLKVLFRKQI